MSDFQPQVPPEHYGNLRYATKERFISYWQQIHEVASLEPKRVLEVGIGSGFVQRFLRELGLNVTTADADPRLGPDVVAVLPELPFESGSFDVVCCFEVLEHLPFEHFRAAVSELRRVSSRHVLLSMPDVTPYGRIRLEWGFKKVLLGKFFDIGRRRPPVHTFDGEHYWEIGKEGTPLERIQRELADAGLTEVSTFRVEEDPWHRFFRARVG
jgi:SAM-dependent methyltransferase